MKINFDDNANNRNFLEILSNIRKNMLRLETALKNGILITSNNFNDDVLYELSSESISNDIQKLLSCFDKIVMASDIIGEMECNLTVISDETNEKWIELEKTLDKLTSEICKGEYIELKVIKKYTNFVDSNQLSFWE